MEDGRWKVWFHHGNHGLVLVLADTSGLAMLRTECINAAAIVLIVQLQSRKSSQVLRRRLETHNQLCTLLLYNRWVTKETPSEFSSLRTQDVCGNGKCHGPKVRIPAAGSGCSCCYQTATAKRPRFPTGEHSLRLQGPGTSDDLGGASHAQRCCSRHLSAEDWFWGVQQARAWWCVFHSMYAAGAHRCRALRCIAPQEHCKYLS